MSDPKWKQFEILVAKIQADLAGAGAFVTPNDKIMGKTGIYRQIDVSIRANVGQFQILVVIDCKDYNHPLDIKDVEEFISMSQDVGAHRAAMVAAKGYSEAAKLRAKGAQIELYTVVDTGDHPWKTKISVPAVYQHSIITEIGIQEVVKGPCAVDGSIPGAEIEIFDMDGKLLGRLVDLIHAKWNAGEFPDRESGSYGNLTIVQNPVKMLDFEGQIVQRPRSYAHIKVEASKFFGHLELTQFSGLHDVSTGHTLGRRMVTAPVGRDLEKTWQRIERVEDLAVRPVMTFECSAAYGDFDDEEE